MKLYGDANSPPVFDVRDFGAVADGVKDDSPGINDAIEQASTLGGGVVQLMRGNHLLKPYGQHNGFDYGIMMMANVVLRGYGPWATRLVHAQNSNMVGIISNQNNPTNFMSLVDFKINGDYSNNPEGEFNIWLSNGNHLLMQNVHSSSSKKFGVRLEDIQYFNVDSVVVLNVNTDPGSDGIHLYDCAYGAINGARVAVSGDDGFVITAQNDDTHNITVRGLVCGANVNAVLGTGIKVNLADSAEQSGEQHSIFNISIDAQTYDCKGAAAVLSHADMSNIDIRVSDVGSRNGLYLIAGSPNVMGDIVNSRFNIQSKDAAEEAIVCIDTHGEISGNTLNAQVFNPGDNKPGASIRGKRWSGGISMDYDPTGSKTSPSLGIDWFATDSVMQASCTDALHNLNLRADAKRNTFTLGDLSGGVNADIMVHAQADNNVLVGGAYGNLVNNSATTRVL